MNREARPPSMLSLMPFPALNPWNWGALTPMAAMATGVTVTRLGLSVWHAYVDASRAIFREREEAALAIVESMLEQADEPAAEGKQASARASLPPQSVRCAS